MNAGLPEYKAAVLACPLSRAVWGEKDKIVCLRLAWHCEGIFVLVNVKKGTRDS